MKYFTTIICFLLSLNLFSLEVIGEDSGGKPIILYENDIKPLNSGLAATSLHQHEVKA